MWASGWFHGFSDQLLFLLVSVWGTNAQANSRQNAPKSIRLKSNPQPLSAETFTEVDLSSSSSTGVGRSCVLGKWSFQNGPCSRELIERAEFLESLDILKFFGPKVSFSCSAKHLNAASAPKRIQEIGFWDWPQRCIFESSRKTCFLQNTVFGKSWGVSFLENLPWEFRCSEGHSAQLDPILSLV